MKYEVIIKLIEVYELEIEAESEDEAKRKADDIMESPHKYDYHVDSDAEITAYEV